MSKTGKIIVYFCIAAVVCLALYYLGNYRTPSKNRLETLTGIRLPDNAVVLEDSFVSDVPHYTLDYAVRIPAADAPAFINAITTNNKWVRGEKGYTYSKDSDTWYHAALDTTTLILTYTEWSN